MEKHPVFTDLTPYSLKGPIDSMQSLSKFQWHFFLQKKKILKFIWNHKEPQTAKTILRKNNKARGLAFSDFKTYYKAKVIKTVKCWHKDRYTDPPNKPRHTVKISLTKLPRLHNGKRRASGKTSYPYAKEWN